MNGGTNLKTWIVISVFLLGMGCTAAAGRTIYVDNYGTADFNTIQAAIDDSNDGDTIIVADGTYTGNGNRDIDFLGKAITLRSENGPENCIIDCNGTEAKPHRGFFFRHGEDANSVLEGFTITNGYADFAGGGILCNGNLTISNCIITNNRAKDDGGGIACSGSSPTIRNCIITKNIAEVWEGGGIRFHSCKGATLDNCLITENSAKYGGGIGSSGDNSPIYRDIIVTNCTFSANSAQYGGAVYARDGSKPSMVNCILWGDTALYGPEIALSSMWPVAFLYVSFSDVQGGEAAVYDRSFLYWGPGNTDAAPCFADPCNGDYHLKSQADRWDPNIIDWVTDTSTSPCIDAGNPGCPLGDEPNDPNNLRINMGAYGGTSEASKSPANWRNIADITNDWIVDFNDFKVFVDYWLETGECIPSDFNRNQFVDFVDFALMALHWLECTAPECETIVEVSAETDKSTYLLGEVVTVFVTAYNPNPEPVTLYFGSSLEASYLMDGVFDWSEWHLFNPVILQLTIEPYNSSRWTLHHGSDEMEIYPLDIGTHTVVGEVVGYGCSAPVEFEVVAE